MLKKKKKMFSCKIVTMVLQKLTERALNIHENSP